MRWRALIAAVWLTVSPLCAAAQPQPQVPTPAPAVATAAKPAPPSPSDPVKPNAAARAVVSEVQTSETVRTALALSLLALIPALAICMTPFVRIVVVLSMIRHGLGMPETPPNQVLVSLAIFLTAFTMMPTLSIVNDKAFQPFMAGQLTVERALDEASAPMKAFMLRQVRDQDIKAVYEISRQPLPASAAQVGLMQLTPAFMLNELRVSFKIGFVVLLPFLLIDLVVSSILLSLGMLMVPPATLSLPIKVLMFVLVDGWSLVMQGVVGSFH